MIFEGNAIEIEVLEDGIVELRFDQKGAVNKFSADLVKEFGKALDALEADPQVRGVVITSAKDSFIVGADITEFAGVFDKGVVATREMLQANNENYNRLEELSFPTVAAINGFALGGGLELALACDFRVGSTKARVGLPEVGLGLIPAWGGTVRLPRIAGAKVALDWIAAGQHHSADDALNAGILDEVVAHEELKAAAVALVQSCLVGEKNFARRRAQKHAPLSADAQAGIAAFESSKAAAKLTGNPNYPAAGKALSAIKKAAAFDCEQALEVEENAFVELAQGSVARALINIFLNDQTLVKKARAWESRSDKRIESAAVLGAGIMGGGISYQSALKGIPTIMKDIAQAGLDLGVSEAKKLLQKRVDRGAMSPEAMNQVLERIRPTLSYDGIENTDVVVEAVVENPKVKHAVLSEVESKVSEDTVLASNTSTIAIDHLAEVLQRPENFCGMHFFNPVHAMPLVEVVRGTKTSDRAVARTVAYANAMGKKAVVVKDCPGFLVNRVFFPYLAGFSMLVRDGADFRRVDEVMERWGWPMGPAYLLDVIGIDTAAHAIELMAEGYPDRMNKDFKDCIEVLYEAERFGQKNGKGFYEYPAGEKGKPRKNVTKFAYELLRPHTARRKEFSDEEIIARMMVPMATEMARCIDEEIVGTPAEADISLVYGLGFPSFRGGLFSWIDSLGVDAVCAMADKYRRLGPLYEPTASMRKKAEGKQSYF